MSNKHCRILVSSLLCALCAFVVNSDFARAQEKEKPKPGDVMIDKYLAQETDKLSQRFLDGAKTLDEWKAKLPRLREEYLYMLGLWPLPEKTPLHPVITGKLEADGVIIEKLHFQSKPGLYVTGNLYRPKPGPQGAGLGKLPAILYVCGHSGRGRDGNKTAFQDHGMWFASNGYICLIIDTLQLGEIPGIHHGTYGRPYNHFRAYGFKDKDVVENRWWWQARGYTPAGVECWNGIRAIDYLVSRPDVDPERIGVTGISGGGAATIWISAADERVKCAVPVSGMSDLESYVKNKIIDHHCDCMLMINTYGWEWTTIAALIAPRPMLFCNSDHDTIFPMDGNNRIAARLRQLYKMYDKPELFDDYVSKGGHDYRPDLRIAIFKWINKHLKNDTGPVKDADFKPLAGKELRVFPEDSDVPKDAINGKIDETFVPKAVVRLPDHRDFEQLKEKWLKDHKEGPRKETLNRLAFEDWKRKVLKELRDKSFHSLPTTIPAAESRESNFLMSTFITESPIETLANRGDSAVLEVSRGLEKKQGGQDIWERWKEQRLHLGYKKWAAFHSSLFPRGFLVEGFPVEGYQWTTKSPPNYVERSHVLIGHTVDEGRVFDVLSFARYVAENDPDTKKKKLTAIGMGQYGILAAYAAIFDPNIREVAILNPPVSHRDGPIFLNVLRVLDIPEALGLLAPRPLTLINAADKAFDRTAEIYKLAGAEKNFHRR